MNKRLNITLPEQTARLIDRVAGKGRRSSLINQIRTIDKRRLGKRLGVVRSATMKQVDRAIMISFALIDI